MKKHCTFLIALTISSFTLFLNTSTAIASSCPGPKLRGTVFEPAISNPQKITVWANELEPEVCLALTSLSGTAVTLTHEVTGKTFNTESTGFVMIETP